MSLSYCNNNKSTFQNREAVGFRLFRGLLYIAIALYPVLPVNYYVGSLSYANICSISIVLLYVISEHGKLPPIQAVEQNKAFWIFEIFLIFATFITVDILHGISTLVSLALVSLVVVDLAKSEDNRRKIFDGIIWVATVLAILAFCEAFSGHYLIQADLLSETGGERYGILRAAGPFGNPILLGLYQAIAALICFYRMVLDDKRTPLPNSLCVYIVIVASVLITVSRLALCFFIVGQLLLLLRKGTFFSIAYFYFSFAIVLAGIALLTILGFNLNDLVEDFFSSLASLLGFGVKNISSDTIGFGNRLDLYSWVVSDIGNNWLFGLGVGAPFVHVINDWTIKTSIEVHYLYIFYQCGLVGLVLLVASYIGTLHYISKKISVAQKEANKNLLFLFLVILALYYICLFGVQETDLARLSCELVALSIGCACWQERDKLYRR